MPLLLGLLLYLSVAIAIVGGAAAYLLSAVEPAVTMVPAQQDARKVTPRVQAWLDREAEGHAYAEKEKAAASEEKELAEARRMKAISAAEHAAFARARDEEKAAERESATRTRDNAKREAERRSRELRDAEDAEPPSVAEEQSLQYFPDLHGRSQ